MTVLQASSTVPEPAAPPLGATPSERQLPLAGVLVVAAVAYGCFAQGAYYPRQQLLLVVLVAAALAASLRGRALQAADLRLPPVAGALALAAVALLSAAAAGDLGAATGPVGLLAALAATVVAVRRLDDGARARLGDALVWLGALVAFVGWLAVAHRLHPYALEDQRLWRAATTLTYANAAAGLLVPLALVGAARQVAQPADRAGAAALFAVLTGLGATLSRGGLVALAVGGALVVTTLGPRRAAVALWAPVAGAVVALAGLVPSMPADVPPRPAIAWAAAALGAAVAIGAPRRRWRRAVLVVTVAAALVAVLAPGRLRAPLAAVTTARATVASQDRIDEAVATWRLASRRPVLGVGPGHFVLRYQAGDGRGPLLARYAHNEYLQTLAVLGVVGLAVLLVGMAATALAVVRSRRHRGGPAWAGVVAALAAFAVHSSMDFLWHLPALPLVAAVLVGLTVDQPSHKPRNTDRKEAL